MNDHNVIMSSIINEIRSHLMKNGEIGLWLINQIDEALEAGYETEEDHQIEMFSKSNKEKSGVVYRAYKNDWEILDVYLNMLESYMYVLPSCVQSAEKTLREYFQINDVRISMFIETMPKKPYQETTYYANNIAPESIFKNKELFYEIHHLIRQLRK